jgi:hypothetical protein
MRKYASFFEWFEKDRKELGVAEELLGSLNATGTSGLHSLSIYKPDPPDCVCLNSTNQKVAIEVAEVVCSRAAYLNAKGRDVMRFWEPGDLSAHVNHLLIGKDGKTFHGGPYAETIACLFTDEPMLTLEHAQSELQQSSFGPFRQLTGAFLVFSYDPHSQSYPVLPLTVQHVA